MRKAALSVFTVDGAFAMRHDMRALWILGILAVLIMGCTQAGKPSMEYLIKPCDMARGAATEFEISASSGVVKVHQIQSYVCCANITLSMETEGKVIRVYEDNIGEMCKCICPFEANIELSNVEGYERIEIYSVKFKDVQDYELLFNSTIPG